MIFFLQYDNTGDARLKKKSVFIHVKAGMKIYNYHRFSVGKLERFLFLFSVASFLRSPGCRRGKLFVICYVRHGSYYYYKTFERLLIGARSYTGIIFQIYFTHPKLKRLTWHTNYSTCANKGFSWHRTTYQSSLNQLFSEC